MKTLVTHRRIDRIKYTDYAIRLFASIIASLLIIPQGEHQPWYLLFSKPGYLKAFLASVLISLLTLYVIFLINQKLEMRVSWLGKPGKRWMLQLLFGFLLPLGTAIAVAAIYFGFHHYYLTETTYFENLLLPISIMIIAANFYYMFQHSIRQVIWVERERIKLAKLVDLEASNQPVVRQENLVYPEMPLPREIAPDFKLPDLCRVEDIQMVISINRVVWYYSNGQKQLWPNGVKKTMDHLPASDFFQVNKSCIINRHNISIAYIYDERRVELLLHAPLNGSQIVAKDKKQAFRHWYGKKIYPKRLQGN